MTCNHPSPHASSSAAPSRPLLRLLGVGALLLSCACGSSKGGAFVDAGGPPEDVTTGAGGADGVGLADTTIPAEDVAAGADTGGPGGDTTADGGAAEDASDGIADGGGPPCQDTCDTAGAPACGGGGVVTCVVLPSGCLGYEAAVPCATGETCSNGVCSSTCADECGAGESQCTGQAVQTCGEFDGDACLDWGDPQACDGCGACVEGTCVAPCSDECPFEGATQCQGGGVRTCGPSDGGCCLVWAAAAPCGGDDPCTTASCANGECTSTALADQTPCDDGDPCTLGDVCLQGTCVSGPAPSCDAGATCVEGACVCGLTVQGGEPIPIDIPFAAVQLDVTLGGAALPSGYVANDFGRLRLRAMDGAVTPAGNASGGLPSIATLAGRVIPGTYDVLYEGQGTVLDPGRAFPLGAAVLAAGVPFADGATVKIDIPSAKVTFDVTLGGAPLPATYVAGDWGRLLLRAADGAVTEIGSVGGGTSSVGSLSGRVVPGTYDVLYESYSTSPAPTFAFPVGHGVIAAGVALTPGAMVALDIPAAPVTFDVTLGGEALPTQSAANDWGRLFVRGPDGQASQVAVVAGGQPSKSTVKVRVLPGTYDVVYEPYSAAMSADAAFPAGSATLAKGVALTSGATVAVDIPWVSLKLNVTLGGKPLPETTEGGDTALITLRRPDGVEAHIGAVTGGMPSKGTLVGRVVPGTYDVIYASQAGALLEGLAFPAGGATLASGVVLTTGKTLALDIPTGAITVDVTLGGGPLPVKYTVDDWGRVLLRHADGTVREIGNVSGGTTSAGALAGAIVPGTYDVLYESYAGQVDEARLFPSGRAVLATGVKLAGGVTLALDIPVAEVRFDVTLAKGTLPPAFVSDDWGWLRLRGPLGEPMAVGSVGGGMPSFGTLVGRVVPGDYEVSYASFAGALAPAAKLPLSGGAALGCAVILPTELLPPTGAVVINEVAYDGPGSDTDVFIELKGPPGMALDGWSLVAINGNGGAVYDQLALTGAIGADGYLVVAKAGAGPAVSAATDIVDGIADLQNGPDSLQLQLGGVVVDAVAYGDFGAGDVAAGEGAPAPDTTTNGAESISRVPDGADTDDNATDFVVTSPTPGAPNQ